MNKLYLKLFLFLLLMSFNESKAQCYGIAYVNCEVASIPEEIANLPTTCNHHCVALNTSCCQLWFDPDQDRFIYRCSYNGAISHLKYVSFMTSTNTSTGYFNEGFVENRYCWASHNCIDCYLDFSQGRYRCNEFGTWDHNIEPPDVYATPYQGGCPP